MRKYLLAAGLLPLLFCGVCSADDDTPKVEIFGGYSYLHADTDTTGIVDKFPEGFNADVTYYLYSVFGGTADFQYHKKDFGGSQPQANCPVTVVLCGDLSIFNFHVGPRFKARTGKVEPFAHALFGFSRGSFDPNGGTGKSENAFSTKLGAGLDLVPTRHWAIRLAEANFYYSRFKPTFSLNGEDHQNNFTLSTGVVYRF